MQGILANENAGQLDDDAFVMALCDAILDGNASNDDGGRARHKILTTVCVGCQQAWQHGGGRDLPVSETEREISECDAQRVGSDREPGTATQDVTPKVRRFVLLRDHKRCVVPGCRASRHIDIHHIEPQHLGGGHEPENLTSLCAGHHRALHDGLLTITGDAPNLVVAWKYPMNVDASATDSPHVGPRNRCDARPADGIPSAPPAIDRRGPERIQPPQVRSAISSSYGFVVMKTEAVTALAQMGFTKQVARAVGEEAAKDVPRDLALEGLMRAALRLTKR